MATSIASQIGEDKPMAVIATTLVAYSLSSILTGELPSLSCHILS
jgi:SulP family sulfate permease